ncbi:MAG: DUF115 domain-containing protein [Spirochaetaceae bacterium]|nr:MAG: DUF115 domain-containing protein [Spirochaetaceae bacterium]
MMPDQQQQPHSALSCRGRRLYGPSPREGGERRAEAFQALTHSLVLLPSPLHGFGLSTIMSSLPADSLVVAVELEPELNLLSVGSPESLLPALLAAYPQQLRYRHAPNMQQLLQDICRELPSHLRRVQMLSLNNGYSLNAQAYRKLQQGIEDELARLWRNRATTLALGPLWVRNLFRNLPLLTELPRLSTTMVMGDQYDGVGHQSGGHQSGGHRCAEQATTHVIHVKHPHRPVIVVGAGASLEADIDIILDVRQEVTLVAADSALMPLQGHGITPDLVVILEAQPVNREHFLLPLKTQFDASQDIPFTACDLSSLPTLARRSGKSRGLLFVTRFADISLFDRIEQHGLVPATVAPVGSVGVCAIMLTASLFGGPIGITGFDSAYSGGLPHTRGAASHRWALRRSTRLDQEPLFAFLHGRRPIEVVGKGDRSYLSEPTLLGSAERISELFDSWPRIFDFGSTGLKLGRKVESTNTAVRAALKLEAQLWDKPISPKPRQYGERQRTEAKIAEPPISAALLCAFVEAEIALLDAGIRELTELEDGHLSASLSNAIPQLEYLYFDVSPTAPTHSAGRRRALLQAHRYRELLQQSLTEIHRSS